MGCAAGVESKADEPEKGHRNGEPKGKVSRKKKKKAKGGGASDNNGAFDGVMTTTKRPADEEGGGKAKRKKTAGSSGSDDKKRSKGKTAKAAKAKAKKGKEMPSPKTGHTQAVNWTTESVQRHFDFSAASILSSEKMRKVDRWMFSRPIQSFPLSSPQETAEEQQGAAAPSNEDKEDSPSKSADPDLRPRSDSLLLRKLSVQELTALMPDIVGQKQVTSSVVTRSSVQVDLNEERESLGPSTPSKTASTPPTANHTAEPHGRKKT
eukprot:Rhum_TRINITY_DN13932_c0_g1::Rhum_TRINITY_DN13932_c0_g1_i1::g.65540::m.65540